MQSIIRSQQVRITTPIVAALLALVLLSIKIKFALLFAGILALIVGVSILKMSPGKGLQIYFFYLLFEGGIKIWTNYNPIFHVGSDILLLSIFARLVVRKTTTDEMDGIVSRENIASKIVPFLIIFWLWVAVQFFNPWGIGLVPSLASLKIYVIPILLFFMVSFLMKDEEIRPLPYIILILGIIQAAAASIDGSLGDQVLPSMHPRYMQTLNGKFNGIFYRPFGTTNLPGGPAAWMYHCFVGAIIVCALEIKKQAITKSKWFIPVITYIVLALTTLAFCQVRTAAIKFVGIGLLGAAFLSPRKSIQAIVFVMVLGLVASADLGIKLPIPGFIDIDRAEVLLARYASLGSKETWTEARVGALDGMINLSEKTVMGIGLSRTGAASGPWQEKLKKEPMFGNRWAFSDNLYRAIFTELGIFGFFAFLLLFGAILWNLFNQHNFICKLIFVYTALYMVAGFASEGILYQPDAAFMWFYLAWAFRADKIMDDPDDNKVEKKQGEALLT
jgi:hypothetical protein